jgi:transposase-like protein
MEPRSLQEAILSFAEPKNCREYLVARRWPDGVICPRCQSKNVIFLEKYNRWHCREKHKASQFTLKTGTIFEDSPLGLDKWLTAMWMIVNCKNGVSSWEISRTLRITQKSAWFMNHRIRLALQRGSIMKLGGRDSAPVEVDETFIGGKARNMHKPKRLRVGHGIGMQGGHGKTVVMGMLERGGQVRAAVIAERKRPIVEQVVRENIVAGSEVHTDEFPGYRTISEDYTIRSLTTLRSTLTARCTLRELKIFGVA